MRDYQTRIEALERSSGDVYDLATLIIAGRVRAGCGSPADVELVAGLAMEPERNSAHEVDPRILRARLRVANL